MATKKTSDSSTPMTDAVSTRIQADPEHPWRVVELADDLSTTPAALSRALKQEKTTFTRILYGIRHRSRALAAEKTTKPTPKTAKEAKLAPKTAKKPKPAPKTAKKPKPAKKPKKPKPAKKPKKVELPEELPPPAIQARTPDLGPPLPVAYGVDRVAAMARDPQSAFIYWELTPEGHGKAQGRLTQQATPQLVLRLYTLNDKSSEAHAVRSEAHTVRDVIITDWIGSHIAEFDRPGLQIFAAIGLRADDGFAHIARSQVIEFPRRSPGDEAVSFSTVTEGQSAHAEGYSHQANVERLADFVLDQAVDGDAITDLNHVMGSHTVNKPSGGSR